MKTIGMIFLIIFSFNIAACEFPIHGEQYNNLVVITKSESKNNYILTIPRSVNSSDDLPSVFVNYYALNNTNTPIAEHVQEVEMMTLFERLTRFLSGNGDEFIELKFTSEKRDGFRRALSVSWPNDVCDTYALKYFD